MIPIYSNRSEADYAEKALVHLRPSASIGIHLCSPLEWRDEAWPRSPCTDTAWTSGHANSRTGIALHPTPRLTSKCPPSPSGRR